MQFRETGHRFGDVGCGRIAIGLTLRRTAFQAEGISTNGSARRRKLFRRATNRKRERLAGRSLADCTPRPQIFDRIAEWQGPELRLQERLRAEFPDEIVRGALSLVELRAGERPSFPGRPKCGSTAWASSKARPNPSPGTKRRRFQGRGIVWDYCSGIGGDSIMLAEHCKVISVDREPASCLCTRYNAEAYGVAERVTSLCADVETLADRGGLLHIDPDRRPGARPEESAIRSGRRRSLRLEEGSPALESLIRLSGEFRGGAIKSSPAANFGGKFPAAEIELVSLHGECKEATIWFGELAERGLWRATVLPSGETIAGDPLRRSRPFRRSNGFFSIRTRRWCGPG